MPLPSVESLNAREDQKAAIWALQSTKVPQFSAELKGVIGELTGTMDDITTQFQNLLDTASKDSKYPVTLEQVLAPVSTFYNEQNARLNDVSEAQASEINEQIRAAAEGSGDMRPWATTNAIVGAMSQVTRVYSEQMRLNADARMQAEVSAMLNWANSAATFEVQEMQAKTELLGTLLGAQNQLIGIAANYQAQLAGTEAQMYAAELGANAQVAASMIGASASIQSTAIQAQSRFELAQFDADQWFKQSDYEKAFDYEKTKYVDQLTNKWNAQADRLIGLGSNFNGMNNAQLDSYISSGEALLASNTALQRLNALATSTPNFSTVG